MGSTSSSASVLTSSETPDSSKMVLAPTSILIGLLASALFVFRALLAEGGKAWDDDEEVLQVSRGLAGKALRISSEPCSAAKLTATGMKRRHCLPWKYFAKATTPAALDTFTKALP
eukprot:CAMPEP_0183455260 /NCGR_PEP_ID=MMETSP0370-20130417/126176_1 /TAXON_ID=268820 /ORGANISM="Peridinium aciculiferum, Strain PAER-2" /LENGTH=115 /DNA_ID=CAMNT_0025646837 /DNA_START=278 /DNA_END=621 /DNA_ORIENTATION=+